LLAALVLLAGAYYVLLSPVSVTPVTVRTGDVTAEVMGTGTLEARTKATISPKISGRLASVSADQGDRVGKGELLATLDDADLRQQVEVGKAEVAAARATVERWVADIARAEARARQTTRAFDRQASLRGSGAASEDEFDKATEDRDIAEAELERARLAKVEAERQAAKAEQSLRYDEERLADTRVTAPFDGLVVRRLHDPGDVVVPGAAVLEVISTDQIWLAAWVDETEMNALAVGQSARVVFRSDPDRPYRGKVARLSPQADRETREFLVDVALDQLPRTWAVGQRAEVYIETRHRSAVVTIPQRAVVWREGRAGVILDDSGKARWREVKLGVRGRDDVEVVEGLSPGQVVVTVGPGIEPPKDGRGVRARAG
jgi:HlyD family secretion protein